METLRKPPWHRPQRRFQARPSSSRPQAEILRGHVPPSRNDQYVVALGARPQAREPVLLACSARNPATKPALRRPWRTTLKRRPAAGPPQRSPRHLDRMERWPSLESQEKKKNAQVPRHEQIESPRHPPRINLPSRRSCLVRWGSPECLQLFAAYAVTIGPSDLAAASGGSARSLRPIANLRPRAAQRLSVDPSPRRERAGNTLPASAPVSARPVYCRYD